jgi:hypothetical protein
MRLPDDSQRLTVVGRTGSGKTQAAVWHLAHRSWDVMPWIVFDFKLDELLNSIPGAVHINTEDLPIDPGIYLVHPHPDDLGAVRAQMRRIWEARNIGVYVDEGYMVCSPTSPNPEFRALLTQGRSLNIPVITLSQRPVWLDRFVYSESDFYQVFTLNDRRDRQTIASYIPEGEADLDERLPDFYSWYYDVGRDELVKLKPVPDQAGILAIFEERLEEMEEEEEAAPPRILFI